MSVKAKRRTSSYKQMLQKIADEYYRETGRETATTKQIARWAIENDKWDPPANLALQKCREDFAKALREQYINDSRGRSVRAKHVVRKLVGDQRLHLWADIRNASREHMEVAFTQRREQIVGDCSQLKRDVDYYNNKNQQSEPIQLEFDFTDDVEESQFDGEYPSK